MKKARRFACSLCGAKQSVRQVYAISGKASDVRGVVVLLNARRQAVADETEATVLADNESCDIEEAAPSAAHARTVDWASYEEEVRLLSRCIPLTRKPGKSIT